ncbi:hypothetical protein MKW92_034464, partial [Papaver armeniacum]
MRNQGHVWNIICGSVDSSVLKCTIELGLLDTIHNSSKPMTLSSLSSDSPSLSKLKTENLYRLLRYLSHMNLITINSIEGSDTFSLTVISKLLLNNQERSLKDWVLGIDDELSINGWHELADYCLYADDAPTPFVRFHGKTLWELAAEVPEINELINNGMASDSRMIMPAFSQGCGSILNSVNKLVDIGGGTGATMSYVAKAFPAINCVVFDLPHVVAAAPDIPGVEMVGGDMFEFIPSADALLLKFMLHGWKDAECIKLLKRCKEIIPADHGKVIIIEMVLDHDEDDDDLTQARLKRTKEEWTILLEEAGFSKIEFIPIFAIQSMKIQLQDQEQEMQYQGQIWNHICGNVDTQVLKCAIKLGVFDTIQNSGKSMLDLTDLSSSLSLSPIKPENLYRLLRYLTHMNLVTLSSVEGTEKFLLTDLSKLLLGNQEKSLKDWAIGIGHEEGMGVWHELSSSCSMLAGGPTPWEMVFGEGCYEYTDKELGDTFNKAMSSDTRLAMPAVIRGCDKILSGLNSLVDVG